MTAPWLTIIGINEDGALAPDAVAHLHAARLVIGGRRHLALAAPHITGETRHWASPIEATIPDLLAARPGPVAILASGDPLWFGVASLVLRHVALAETRILPAPSAFALAAARLGWALQETDCLSCCGRPVEALTPYLQPGARLLVLSAGPATPGAIAALLARRHLEAASFRVLEALGGPAEYIHATLPDTAAALNLVALEIAGPVAAALPLVPGWALEWFEHDGQISRPEIRAITLAALAPRRGETLWDIGCGSGAVGIEWMLAHPANRTIALEARPDRAARARRNADALGVPGWTVIEGRAPEALARMAGPPDAIFLGGGVHCPGLIDAAWAALPVEGRLVANAVTLESEAALTAARARYGGALTRIGIERLDRVGGLDAYRPGMTVTQWRAVRC